MKHKGQNLKEFITEFTKANFTNKKDKNPVDINILLYTFFEAAEKAKGKFITENPCCAFCGIELTENQYTRTRPDQVHLTCKEHSDYQDCWQISIVQERLRLPVIPEICPKFNDWD